MQTYAYYIKSMQTYARYGQSMQKSGKSLKVQASDREFKLANVEIIVRVERFLDESKVLEVFVDRVEELFLPDLFGPFCHIKCA